MRLHHSGKSLELNDDETVLECLERHGVSVPSSCRSGVCQSCLLRSVEGEVPDAAQVGLKPTRKQQGYFLACLCRPTVDLRLEKDDERFESRILETRSLSPSVCGVWLEPPAGFRHAAGQFLQLTRPLDGLTRPYSIASMPSEGPLELHVAVAPFGAMSQWLPGARGQRVQIRGPLGDCVYPAGERQHPLLLAGTGTGMAPLLGIVKTALTSGHEAPIVVLCGARAESGLYAKSRLDALARAHPNLQVGYFAPSLDGDAPNSTVAGRLVEAAALEKAFEFERPQAFVCGNPAFVRSLRQNLYLAGLSLDDIHADAFVSSSAPQLETGT